MPDAFRNYKGKAFRNPNGFVIKPRSWWDSEDLDLTPENPRWHPAMFWDYLISLAVWDSHGRTVRREGEIVHLERGQFFHSIRFLAERPGWGRTKTLNELKRLEKDGRITRESCHHGSIITIVNYDPYQDLTWYLEDAKDMPNAQGSLSGAVSASRNARHPQDTTTSRDTTKKRCPGRQDSGRGRDADETNNKAVQSIQSRRKSAGTAHTPKSDPWKGIRGSRSLGFWEGTPESARSLMLFEALNSGPVPSDLATWVRDQCPKLGLPIPNQLNDLVDDTPDEPDAVDDAGSSTDTHALEDELRAKLEALRTGGKG